MEGEIVKMSNESKNKTIVEKCMIENAISECTTEAEKILMNEEKVTDYLNKVENKILEIPQEPKAS